MLPRVGGPGLVHSSFPSMSIFKNLGTHTALSIIWPQKEPSEVTICKQEEWA